MTSNSVAAPRGQPHPPSIDVEVLRRTTVAESVIELELRRGDGGLLPAWEPGAHIDVVLDDGTIRQYSLCGEPDSLDTYRIAVQREADGRGGSVRICDSLQEDSHLAVRGPRNHFALEQASGYRFIAGGIGITPLLPMIRQAIREGAGWTLHYGGRSRRSMPYLDELVDLDPDGTHVTLVPFDEQQRLIDLCGALAGTGPGVMVYCCGPEPMLVAAESTGGRIGIEVHTERFAPKDVDMSGNSAFRVRIQSTGLELTVPATSSLVDVLLDAGLDVMTSCEEGTCGTCETVVLAGDPDHRDSVLGAEEQAAGDRMMVCVSRSRSATLTLDL